MVLHHISEALVAKLDQGVGEITDMVNDGEAEKASFSITFAVAVDPQEGTLEGVFVIKGAKQIKGSFTPGKKMQDRLPGTVEPVEGEARQAVREFADTLKEHGGSVTVGGRSVVFAGEEAVA